MKLKVKIGDLSEAIARFKERHLSYDKVVNTSDLNIKVPIPCGNSPLRGIIKKRSSSICIVFNNNHTLKCATEHILFCDGHPLYAKHLRPGDCVDSISGRLIVTDIDFGMEQDFYDIGLDNPHVYYDAAGILHHNSLLTASLSAIVEPYGRSVVIVPSKSLVRQTAQDYRNLGLDVGLFYGEKKEWGHKHTIATWQVLASLAKKRSGDQTIGKFINGVTCIMVDECHSIAGAVLRNLLCGSLAHIPIRWGLTGTIPKDDHERIGIIASIGDVVGRMRAVELQSRSVLADCQVDIVQLRDDHVGFRDYDSEHMYLVTDAARMAYIAGLLRDIGDSGNTLVLVDRIESGEILKALIPGSAFVYGETKTTVREQQYRAVQFENCKIIIATYGVAAVGIDMPRLFNLVLLEAGKSFIRTIQSVGRGLRKARDKDYIRIIDICSSLFFSNRHLSKRKRYYSEAQYPHVVKKVNYRE